LCQVLKFLWPVLGDIAARSGPASAFRGLFPVSSLPR
jgi:hypothetical protein